MTTRNTIHINDTWSVEHDSYCWHLVKTESHIATKGKNKGQLTESHTTTYHPTLLACLRHVLDHDARGCQRFSQVFAAWAKAQADFLRALAK